MSSNKKSGQKLLRKLSKRFKKRKGTPLKPIPSDSAVLHNAPSNNQPPRVKGSVRRNDTHDEKLLSEMDDKFRDISFASSQYVMDNLPSSLTMDYLLDKSQFYKEYCDAVERTFKKRLMDNSHSFIIGMQQIQDVKLDLHLTNVLCRNARRTLKESDRCLVNKCFNVISKYQRRKRMVQTLKQLREIQKLKDIEQDLHKHLNENEFLAAIAIHCEITDAIYGRLSKVQCLSLMRKRFRDGSKMITNQLEIELLSIISGAPQLSTDKLLIIWQSYLQLNCAHVVNALLERLCCAVLIIRSTQVVCKHLGYNEAYINRNYAANKNKQVYKKLCRKLKPTQFMNCFMDICGRVFDILHLYYKTERILIEFRSDCGVLSEDMTFVRKTLWIETQNLLGALLECSQFSLKTKIKMEDLLLALHGATVFKIIGQAFSGSDASKLHTSIRHKCIAYLDHFRTTFFESIKTNFDNEMWVVLPIPCNFGIHSIKELQRNTQWTLKEEKTETKDSSAAAQHTKEGDEEKNIYESFLCGENLFDKLVSDKQRKEDSSKKKKANNIFEDAHSHANISRTIAQRPSDDGSEPCITSTSLNLAKFIGRCLQIMESLDPVAPETFVALKKSFHFYLYHVFIWFGVNVHNFFGGLNNSKTEFTSTLDKLGGKHSKSHHHHSESLEEKKRREQQEQQSRIMRIAQKKYPILTRVINQVNEGLRARKLAPELEDLIRKKLKNETRRPRRLPHYAKCYMEASEALDLYSKETMQGVAARFVATETLTFLVNVIKSQHGRLINILLKSKNAPPAGAASWNKQVSSFIGEIENVVREFKKYMYRNVPTLLVHLGSQDNRDSIISHINNTNWNMKQLTTEPNGYVSELISIFGGIEEVLSSFPTLPKFIHNRLNKEAIIYVEEQLVEAYADCKKCTTEGRALMSLDQSVLKKSYPICKYEHSWEYTTNFIQAYYLPQSDLLRWIQQHPQYPLKAHKSFLKIGRASENLRRSRKERQSLEKEIERVYTESKEKQEAQRKEERKNKENKPNLKEINKINKINNNKTTTSATITATAAATTTIDVDHTSNHHNNNDDDNNNNNV